MRKLHDIVAEIVSELSRIQTLAQPYMDEDDNFPFPRLIGVGNGRFINITEMIDLRISDVARHKMNESADLKSRFTATDFRKLVRRAFGPALAKIDLDADLNRNAQLVLEDVEATVREETDWILTNGQREYVFGCTLFVYKDIAPFDIGPVRFEPRLAWLDRKASDGCRARVGVGGRIERFDHQIADGPISKTAKRRIIRAWQGQRLKDRKPSADSHYEQDILKAIGECPYVCSVNAPGFGGKAGRDKALLAARLALATISLIWENSSKALDGINILYDREMRVRYLLSFTLDGLILGGGEKSNMPHAPWVNRGELEKLLKEHSNDTFVAAGEAIAWLLDLTGDHNRPELMNAIVQAMLWFHEGCRESTDLMAIVSFASCMDILGSGDGRKSIRELICARLGIKEGTQIHRDGLTVREVIDQIYDEGRTRFIHGPRRNGKHVWEDKLGHDWSETRGVAERLARMCLVCCMGLAAGHSEIDDPRAFLTLAAPI